MSPIEIELYSEINKLKINNTFIKNYSETIKNDEELLNRALA
jgi:hypothetical protein